MTKCERCGAEMTKAVKVPVGYVLQCSAPGCFGSRVMPVGWHPERKARVSNKARIINITPASASPNWDGTWWQVEWSDGERDQVTITAHRNDHGLGYCRSEARRVALALRQAREAK